MIYVTKMNGQEILINNDLIETVEETPNTIITLTTGKKVIVKESSEQLLQKVIAFKHKINEGDFIKL